MPSPRRPLTGPRHSRHLRRHSWRRVVAIAVVGAMTFTGTAAFALYRELTGNINSAWDPADFRPEPTVEATAEETKAPDPTDPKAGQPYNILVLGSDTREGDNGGVTGGGPEGARADTTLLIHIPADRTRVEVVSIPRDLLTAIPSCPLDESGESSSWAQDSAMFNSAFATGSDAGGVGLGAICALLTVEQLTGVTIDDFAVVDFVGFERMVDTIGGVPMCIPEPLKDDLAGLDLAAGQQTLSGQQALALARARKGVPGDGSDIQRIDRQQELLAAIVRTVLSKNLVTDMPALIQFLDATTSSLTTSERLGNPLSLAGLAMSIAPVGASGVTFVTMPFDYAGARVVANTLTDELWERLRNDEPVNSAAPEPEATDPAAPEASLDPAAPVDPVDPAAPVDPATEETEPTEAPTDPWTVVSGTDETIC